jgi:hypothetical protein
MRCLASPVGLMALVDLPCGSMRDGADTGVRGELSALVKEIR